jgi:nicotinate-nucleotide pyrophosphorylase (carboxylating)
VQDLNKLPLQDLLPALSTSDAVGRLLAIAAEEDLGAGAVPGDVTTQCCIPATRTARGTIIAKEPGVLSGIYVLPHVMSILAAEGQLSFRTQDGDTIKAGQAIAVLDAPMYQVLRAERLMLNLLGRMSGIATRTAAFVKEIKHTGAKLLDTRKTTPGLRAFEKYAVRCGGGHLHRIGLHDAVLFKDNHIVGIAPKDLPAWVAKAADKARRTADIQGEPLRFVELEVDTLDQLEAILSAGKGGCPVDIILLDNMDIPTMRKAIAMRAEHVSTVLFEASGGVTLETIRAIAETGVEYISVGGLTHHAVSLDFSMEITSVGNQA